MKLEGYPEKKNQLIKRLTGLVRKIPAYNGAPDFSYDVGVYRVNRDGSMTVLEDDADPVVIETLISEKLLIDPDPVVKRVEMAINPPDPVKKIEEDGMEESIETPAPVDESSSDDTETPAEEVMEETPEAETGGEVKTSFTLVQAEGTQIYDQPIVIKDRVVMVQTAINLLNMIYSKCDVLNHALGQKKAFFVDDRVIADLSYERPTTMQALYRTMRLKDRSGFVRGIEFTPNAVVFTGFPTTSDPAVRRAYEKLAEGMYKHASETKWLSSKRQLVENEKYYFRNWLNHIYLSGPENRTFREILMKNLDGNGTFRTKDQLTAFQSRRSRQRAAERREKAMAAV